MKYLNDSMSSRPNRAHLCHVRKNEFLTSKKKSNLPNNCILFSYFFKIQRPYNYVFVL